MKRFTKREKPVSRFTNRKGSKIQQLAAQAMKTLQILGGIKVSETKLSDGSKVFFEGELKVDVAVYSDFEMTKPLPDGNHNLENGTEITVSKGLISKIEKPGQDGPATA